MQIEGKTKRIVPGPKTGTILMETKDELTGGDAAKKARIEGIATYKTRQTANVFRYLQRKEIPVAFIEQPESTSLLCDACDMMPLELVMRRYAWGSYLKREPSFQQSDGTPFRFEDIQCEFFHKWAVVTGPLADPPLQMDENRARSLYLKEGTWAEGVYTDPYLHIVSDRWQLHPAKIPFDPCKPLMSIEPMIAEDERQRIIRNLMLPCFQSLEKAWGEVRTEYGPVVLVDLKIEVGRRQKDGEIVIADVIDNDSWRIWPGGDPERQLDKQNFRDGHPLSMVADNYALVAELTQQF